MKILGLKRGRFCFFALILAASGCSTQTAIMNIDGAAVPNGMSSAKVRSSIMEGCELRGWICKDINESTIRGSVWVRGKHFAEVEIEYDGSAYSIIYSGTKNLGYNQGNNTIHKNYNSWVANLNGDIQMSLIKNAP